MMMRISELRHKDVISSVDGKRLGFVSDIEINIERGSLDAIVIPGEGRFFFLFGKSEELVISWARIIKIGVDVILVDSGQDMLKQEPKTTPASDDEKKQHTLASLLKTDITEKDEDDDFFTF